MSAATAAVSTDPVDRAEISFEGHISDAELAIEAAGFNLSLWEPEHGWKASEEEASQTPHTPQKLAALQCFTAFFVKSTRRTWVHLGAEMQAGKTGVINALIRLILENSKKGSKKKLEYAPHRIFVLTGMSDNAWKKQTDERLPDVLRENVYHNSKMIDVAKKLRTLSAGRELSNILIIIDESHIASKDKNQLQTHVYNTIAELCPPDKWNENMIRFLTISATDPAKVIAISGLQDAQVVRLQTTEAYQSIEDLHHSGRIRSLETFKGINTATGITELQRCLTEEFSDRPRYHILRAPHNKMADVTGKIRAAFPSYPVIEFHTGDTSASSKKENASNVSMEDINEILLEAPEQHTFIIIKNMFYASKTLKDENVGVLWDRLSDNDSTTFQSLVGRACGYNKSNRTIVYTSEQAIKNYIKFWKELCTDPRMSPLLSDVSHKDVTNRMGGIDAFAVRGGGVRLIPSANVSAPIASSASSSSSSSDTILLPPKRKKRNADDFEHSYKEYPTFEAAKAAAPRCGNTIALINGFYHSSIKNTQEKQSYTAVMAACAGKATANMAPKDLVVGGPPKNRLYVGYRDINDPTSAVFVVRSLIKVK